METRMWEHADKLLEFIKRTSRGHEFERDYKVERHQIQRGFQRWLSEEPACYPIEQKDVLSESVHSWDGYFTVDVTFDRGLSAEERENKRISTENLIGLFDGWRQSQDTFDQDVKGELDGAKHIYMDSYLQYLTRLRQGHLEVLNDSPMVSMMIEGMRHCLPREMPFDDQWMLYSKFFDSEHFARLPFQYIRSRCYAILKALVKAGAYQNKERSLRKLSGFYSDVDHIAHYAPYCDAIAMDNPMAELVKHPGLALETNFQVKVFSLNNLEELVGWLDDLEASMNSGHLAGLKAAYR